jgi:hypothetical protein
MGVCCSAPKPPARKQRISKKFKRQVWDYYFPNIDGLYCPTCYIYSPHEATKIYRDQYSCGHVVAESLGGKLTVENCRPICTTCNSRMYQTPIPAILEYRRLDQEGVLIIVGRGIGSPSGLPIQLQPPPVPEKKPRGGGKPPPL